ncbi:MAG: DoxX family protein [Verrucomicrobiota bacterium]
MTSSTTLPLLATPASTASLSKGRLWTGRVLSGFAVLALGLDAVMKLVQPEPVVKGTLELGYPVTVIPTLGVVLLVSTLLYAIPRTAVLGAIFLTGYLGGAVATHVRVDNPLFSHTLFPIYVGIIIWGGLFLRNRQVAAVLLGR